ncbi:class I SAM-dependent methyltransferase [Saccharopolyspora griseoalba]|uniref:Class I SAM-dependent methyltransferase n=1 Tax=Saccharopolyspora griseoalba TaxID=1431848 RepID=A0ABW2LVH8_9PSEU
MTGTEYSLGHDDPEVRRLLLQGRLYAEHTDRALRLAGIAPGMRVLDVGCGPGDVSLAAARVVGPTGSVTGVDATPGILDVAERRAAEHDLPNVEFRSENIAELSADRPYDAVAGRLILMHLPDPATTVEHLAGLVRTGGVVTFQEFELTASRTAPPMPLIDRIGDLTRQSFRALGVSTEMGTSLHRVFRRAGLADPRMNLSGPLGAATAPELTEFVADLWRTVLPIAQRLGLDVDGLTDPDAIPERMRAEAGPDTVVVLPPLISAWSTVRGTSLRA